MNAGDLLTVSQTAAEIVVSENTLRRTEQKGWVTLERRPWGNRQPMRLSRGNVTGCGLIARKYLFLNDGDHAFDDIHYPCRIFSPEDPRQTSKDTRQALKPVDRVVDRSEATKGCRGEKGVLAIYEPCPQYTAQFVISNVGSLCLAPLCVGKNFGLRDRH